MILTAALAAAVALLLGVVLWQPPALRRLVGRWGPMVRTGALILLIGLAAVRMLRT